MSDVFMAYVVTLLGVAAAQASPGPNMFAVASAALSGGLRPALWVTAGICSGMLIWAVAVASGLGALFATFPASLLALKFIGGGYLLWLSFRALRSAWRGDQGSFADGAPSGSSLSSWKHGLAVILTNPKAALMRGAVATFLFGSGLAAWQVVLFGPLAVLSGFLIYGTYAVLFSRRLVGLLYKRFFRFIEALFSAAFGALGISLVLDGVRSSR